MLRSMTGFSAQKGSGYGVDWIWEIRAVNGKGLDLRLRLPEIEGLEPAVRSLAQKGLARGNVSINLRLNREDGTEFPTVNPTGLAAALQALADVEQAAAQNGVTLAPSRAVDIIPMRGVLDHSVKDKQDVSELRKGILNDFEAALSAFQLSRESEGAEISKVIDRQLQMIDQLTARATTLAQGRKATWAKTLSTALARIVEAAPAADPARVTQELALLAIKSDITEELDRLHAHVRSGLTLLDTSGPIGRKFEFLTQEFMREANTLCSKSGDADLTAIGLELKHVIDQMREQIQNVE
ncbi:YicC family protein [Thioclava sp. SK-1]|uniref:YicC/YloC family endoribonuclease n=1 Tax=Thioclava sp. SK-1 TaxID=1889770 RepID=UPI000824AC9F|nr:YicC/YloC family endoribonuclease [Thioclava sp. SK-1]OCX62277.1 YicC family protein [Thioclava sp. SK-1]